MSKKEEYEKSFDYFMVEYFEILSMDYVARCPEDFPTDESMQEINDNAGFQEYCEKQYNFWRMTKNEND